MSDAHATPSPAPGASVALDAVPRIGSGFRLQFEPVQQCQVLLYPEGMVKMNGSAGAILERCDGVRSVAAIVADLEATFGAQGLTKDVQAFLEIALQKRWVSLG